MTTSSRRPWIYAALGAVVATGLTVTAVTLLTDDDAEPVSAGATRSPSPSTSGEPSGSVSPSESPTEQESTAGDEAVPVYFSADTADGPRLFREFHRLPADPVDAARVSHALDEALSGAALDPDYRSDWPEGTTVSGVNIDGPGADDVVWVDLGDPALHDRPAGVSQAEASIAVQQVVHTAQAVLQKRHPVAFLLDGQRTDSVLGVPTSEPLAEGDPMAVQGTVWVIGPQDGDHMGRTFTVTGRGAFFEANVSWQLLQDGQVVKSGNGTATECCTLSPYTFTVSGVDPGDYVLRVFDADMSGGEGNGEAEDTKRITVG